MNLSTLSRPLTANAKWLREHAFLPIALTTLTALAALSGCTQTTYYPQNQAPQEPPQYTAQQQVTSYARDLEAFGFDNPVLNRHGRPSMRVYLGPQNGQAPKGYIDFELDQGGPGYNDFLKGHGRSVIGASVFEIYLVAKADPRTGRMELEAGDFSDQTNNHRLDMHFRGPQGNTPMLQIMRSVYRRIKDTFAPPKPVPGRGYIAPVAPNNAPPSLLKKSDFDFRMP